jgi:ketosteroid isomerase-like protein
MINEKTKGGSGKTYSVFEITSKTTGRKHFMVSSRYTLENILSGIRTYVDSKTVGGGAKELAQDIYNAGKNYEEDFTVKEVGKGMSREIAERRRAELVTKSGEVYNQEIGVT